MTSGVTRKEEMDALADAFDTENPNVWWMFVQFTNEVIARGFVHYSVNAIFERIRWETDEADSFGRSTFKLNNNYRAWYARRFMDKYPEHDGFFRTRECPSTNRPATDLPELGPTDFQHEDLL